MLHHMTTILVCYGGHFEFKMAAKIKKSSDLDKICFPSSLCSCELIIVIVFGIGNHIMILQIISYLVIKGSGELFPSLSVVVVRRLSSVVRRKLFQKSSPLKVLDQWKPNLV